MGKLNQFSLFETIPKEQRIVGYRGWWENVRKPPRQVSYPLGQGFQITSDLLLLSAAVVIGLSAQSFGPAVVIMEGLFLSICILVFTARLFQSIRAVAGFYLIVIGVASILNLTFEGDWGSVGLYGLCIVTVYRLPLSWSLPLAALSTLALIASQEIRLFLTSTLTLEPGYLTVQLTIVALLGWVGWTLRSQYLLVLRLHEVQEQLKTEMARSQELAAEQERTRIARDIHDVLSHSLTVLSVQIQAARQLAAIQDVRLGAKLEDMALLVKESISESRQVVGVLRSKPILASQTDDIGASLRSVTTTFKERTGLDCRFEEIGTPHKLNLPQKEMLYLALREILTNSHRHGVAQTAEISLRWEETDLSLVVCDDGRGAKISSPAQSNEGHHGLQGLRERVVALQGEVEAGPVLTGGFKVTLRFPLEIENR